MSGERQSVIITTIIGGGLESSSRSLLFLFIAKKRDGAVQQRGLMSRFYSFWGTFSERKNGIAYLFSAPAGRDARTAQAKRKGHLRFPFLFGLLPFPNITREQLAAMLYRYAGEPDGAADLSAYTDAGSVSAYAEKAVQWCVKNGILTGKTSSTLAPKATATRAECAAMLQRFAEHNM